MARLTVELLRRRAEHNEGCLSTLKEVALHQQDIEKLEVIGDVCRELEIIYLCNNYIPRIEGLRHLKWLKYLNLAVNSIQHIEGLEGCEALEKLDLTLNFVEDMKDIARLRANPFLEILHLTGNPCTRTEGYRAYVVHILPHLVELDGSEIIKSERIAARQEEDGVLEVVDREAEAARERERLIREMKDQGIDPFPPKYNEKGERVYGHSAEERAQMLQEQQEIDEKKKKATEPLPGSISELHQQLNTKPVRLTPEEEMTKYGRLLMRNEGKLPFALKDEPEDEEVTLTVLPGKFISTTLINITADINCIRVVVKGKLLQVPLQSDIAPDAVKVQRATTNGELKITAPRARHLLAMTKEERVKLWRSKVMQEAKRLEQEEGERKATTTTTASAPLTNDEAVVEVATSGGSVLDIDA